MGECFKGQFAQSPLAHAHKDPIAHLAKKHRAHARQPISHRQPDSTQQQRRPNIGARLAGQRIDSFLIEIGRAN